MEPTVYNGLVLNVSYWSFHEGTVLPPEDDPMTKAKSFMMYKIGRFSKCMV